VSDKSDQLAAKADQIRTGWIRRPSNSVAVVFVHGILSSERAWQNDNGSFWPLLVCNEPELSEFGVYLFNYRADAFSGTYSLQDAVDAMKEHFRLDDVISQHTLIFVCHSMGGIVARHFIVTQQTELVRRRTRIGLFLVASPSLGSLYANYVAKISFLYNAQLDALRVGQTNTWLNDLDKNFVNLKESRAIPIYGKELIEDESIFVRRVFRRTQIVQPFSGAKYFGDSVKIPFSNHLSIAKPLDQTAFQHRILREFLIEVAEDKEAVDVRPNTTTDENAKASMAERAAPRPANPVLIALSSTTSRTSKRPRAILVERRQLVGALKVLSIHISVLLVGLASSTLIVFWLPMWIKTEYVYLVFVALFVIYVGIFTLVQLRPKAASGRRRVR
jgi:pimeloyl-ACP methyl ester carboxylesterase